MSALPSLVRFSSPIFFCTRIYLSMLMMKMKDEDELKLLRYHCVCFSFLFRFSLPRWKAGVGRTELRACIDVRGLR